MADRNRHYQCVVETFCRRAREAILLRCPVRVTTAGPGSGGEVPQGMASPMDAGFED